MRLRLLAILVGVVGGAALPVVERQVSTVDAASKLQVVSLIQQYNLQSWCVTWVANLAKYPSLPPIKVLMVDEMRK